MSGPASGRMACRCHLTAFSFCFLLHLIILPFLLASLASAAPRSHAFRSLDPLSGLPPSLTTTASSTPPSPTQSPAGGFAIANSVALSSNSTDLQPGLGQQMVQKAGAAIVILTSLIAYVSVNSLVRSVNPSAFIWYDEDRDEPAWIDSSRSWLDRKACRWLGLCGTAHFRPVRPRFGHRRPAAVADNNTDAASAWQAFWSVDPRHPDHPTNQSDRRIPDYVFEHAPLVHLFSGEQFWPGDIAEHLYHTTPALNYTPIQSQWQHPTLQDLDRLNEWQDGRFVFLTSNDNVEDRPEWIEGEKNVPSAPDSEPDYRDGRLDGDLPEDPPNERVQWYDTAHVPQGDEEGIDGLTAEALGYLRPGDRDAERIHWELRKRYEGHPIKEGEAGGRSEAPAVLLVMDKGNGIVDAFWFYFYSFNLGNVVLNVRFGNHIGDWEHCLVRFHHGKPKALFFSAHSGGEAYSYDAVEKIGKRPVIYSAMGTHAMYATPGVHDYILPWGLLHDQTDRGPLWDPLLNTHSYTYDYDNDTLRASTASPDSPTEWFYFKGHWGDKFYPLGDHRQYRFAGQYHYVNGPLGPRFKHLNRRKVCQGPDDSPCVIKNYIWEKKRAKRWDNTGPGDTHV
ncbi:vacuolar protein sorting protein 62 [Aspergillus terreus]|uniref:Vacuolar protein sorting protein 62 n=1 Tax=Aspergillus terreus TaxID=33178 RepID=A0A5M3Z8D4_ASPTE|nr:hypothetical protein ATETN484_0010053700 [Aspergillus terreus]GFF18584.1 vacuolar protein sorting protein 62 [Aspergillus terreus]